MYFQASRREQLNYYLTELGVRLEQYERTVSRNLVMKLRCYLADTPKMVQIMEVHFYLPCVNSLKHIRIDSLSVSLCVHLIFSYVGLLYQVTFVSWKSLIVTVSGQIYDKNCQKCSVNKIVESSPYKKNN